jgi:hypothetical protein
MINDQQIAWCVTFASHCTVYPILYNELKSNNCAMSMYL